MPPDPTFLPKKVKFKRKKERERRGKSCHGNCGVTQSHSKPLCLYMFTCMCLLVSGTPLALGPQWDSS